MPDRIDSVFDVAFARNLRSHTKVVPVSGLSAQIRLFYPAIDKMSDLILQVLLCDARQIQVVCLPSNTKHLASCSKLVQWKLAPHSGYTQIFILKLDTPEEPKNWIGTRFAFVLLRRVFLLLGQVGESPQHFDADMSPSIPSSI